MKVRVTTPSDVLTKSSDLAGAGRTFEDVLCGRGRTALVIGAFPRDEANENPGASELGLSRNGRHVP